MNFRKLNADEIDCRISTVSEKGLSLLLYKDARVDMRLLDEVVGAENWQRKHELINGNLFCSVGIKCGTEWVWKQDVGVESYTEKEIGIHAIRGGNIVGEHEVIFAGTDEVITLSHSARSKEVFATGAVNAAKFITGKPAGMYSMKELIG